MELNFTEIISPSPSREGVRGRGWLLGLQRYEYVLQHTVGVQEDIVIPETNQSVAATFEPCRPPVIRVDLLGMLATVQFHNQFLRKAHEVHNIRTYGMLPSKSITTQLMTA